jgi:ferritin-like metal-binding protein YciE
VQGNVKESEDFLKEDATTSVRDAGIIAACQRIEHYEIAGYGTARHYAQELGHGEIARLLEQTLNEEKTADHTLNDLAIERLNKKAEKAGVEA